MKNSTLALVAALLLATATYADEQSSRRTQLAREVFDAAGGVSRLRSTMQVFSQSLRQAYGSFYLGLASEIDFESEEARRDFIARAQVEGDAFLGSFDLLEEVGYYDLAIETLVPIYADLYSEEELEYYLEFLKSPVGQKMNSTQGERLSLATQSLMADLQPRISAAIQNAFAGERDRILASLP